MSYRGDEDRLWRGREGTGLAGYCFLGPSFLPRKTSWAPQLKAAKPAQDGSFSSSCSSALGPLTVTPARPQTVTRKHTRHVLRGRNRAHVAPVSAYYVGCLHEPIVSPERENGQGPKGRKRGNHVGSGEAQELGLVGSR